MNTSLIRLVRAVVWFAAFTIVILLLHASVQHCNKGTCLATVTTPEEPFLMEWLSSPLARRPRFTR